MANFFARQGAEYINEMNRGLGALLGIATGILSDRNLADSEIHFLDAWLSNNSAISTSWPGDVISSRIKAVISDGIITDEERDHLVNTLQDLIGGTLENLAASMHVTQLLPYETPEITFSESNFCLTGDFVFAPRGICEQTIQKYGGIIKSSVSNKLNYLVIGGLGSKEWKHGSFGTKIEKAIELKRDGAIIFIVHEDHWAKSLPRDG